jgi:hypothetical protein
MANKAHKPFTEENPELTSFLTKLHRLGYEGPLTLELAHNTALDEIARSKAFFEGILEKIN